MNRIALSIAVPAGLALIAVAAFVAILFGRAEQRLEIARGMTRTLSGVWDGQGDCTFSAWSWHMKVRGKKWGATRSAVVDWLSSPGHCERAWAWHQAHRLFDRDDA
jgi:hypothetical protein